jgi:hypothetical protein
VAATFYEKVIANIEIVAGREALHFNVNSKLQQGILYARGKVISSGSYLKPKRNILNFQVFI